ncbi:alpha/beta fold hydrolase [Leucobacter sp. NPDC058333]|uniref:alpha/beta fold hydrolase n=1 Tax=Leucobacter sp. NPDC058333 TaxID=3346450 RepID=UPI00364CC988
MIAEVRGQGVPLIAIHGFGVDHRIMLPLEEMLDGMPETGEWQRVYLDLPWAQGATDNGAPNPRAVADFVVDEVRHIAGDGPFAIIGNSFGAMIARHVAHALSEQCIGLATFAGVFVLDHAERTLPHREIMLRDERVLELAGDGREDFAAMAVLQTAAALRAFEEFVLPGLRGANQEVLDRLSETYSDGYVPETDALQPFDAPSLHVFGRQDHVVGFEDGLAFAHHYSRGTFSVLDSAGHNLHLEQPEIVGALLRDWLLRASRFAQLNN